MWQPGGPRGSTPGDNWRHSTGRCVCMSIASNHPCALVSKQRTDKKISCCYDPAKTPLQRLLFAGILPVETQQELNEVAQALDPVRLLEQLQQALFHCAAEANPFVSPA